MLQFSEKFDEKPVPERIAYLKKVASAMNDAADIMQKERDELAQQLAEVKASLAHAETNLGIQKTLLMQTITEHNAERQVEAETIEKLRYRIKKQDEVIDKLNS